MSDDLEMKMNNMILNEQITTKQLKEMHSALSIIVTLDFGMKEDTNFIVPKTVTQNCVELMKVQKHKKREKINENVRKAQALMLLIHKEIKDYQLYNYNYLMTKKRGREYEREGKMKKKRRKEETEARREEEAKQSKRIRNAKPFSFLELLDVESVEKGFDSDDSDVNLS